MSNITLNEKSFKLNIEGKDHLRQGNLYRPNKPVPYQEAWQWQRRLVAKCKAAIPLKTESAYTVEPAATKDLGSINRRTKNDGPKEPGLPSKDSLILLQHPPVYTLGQGADLRFLRFDPNKCEHEIHRIERGGEVTYHCPGQLVGYPILDLHHYQKDLHWYLRQLEEVLIQTLAHYTIKGERVEGMTGVWVEGAKVAAIGIKVSRWITMHGFALNVCPELSGFDRIVPCGLTGKAVGSMAQFLPDISVDAVQDVVIAKFEQVFDLGLETAPIANLQSPST